MAYITDRMLSLPRMSGCSGKDLRQFYALLLRTGVDQVEISAEVLEKIGNRADPARTVLRVRNAAEVPGAFPFSRYVCSGSGVAGGGAVCYEHEIKGFADTERLNPEKLGYPCRAVGLDDLLLYDYAAAFERIAGYGVGTELCPRNQYGCAGALAVEWLRAGNEAVAVSFLGQGGFAPLEEVLLALHVTGVQRPEGDLSVLTRLKKQYEYMTGDSVPPHKSVLGERIFHVESGVHVDGILKDASNYEPFDPRLVGMTRTIQAGKHSGRATITCKLQERGFTLPEEAVSGLLTAVQALSIGLGRGLREDEFDALIPQERKAVNLCGKNAI